MRFNIAYPATGGQKKIDIDDEKNIRPFFDKKMGQDVDGELMGEDYKGYVFRITGGNDKQGFTMKQGVFKNGRTRILFKKRGTTFRPRRTGERKRKSVRGCIAGPDMAVIALRIMKKGEKEIAGITDVDRPNRLQKKRRSNIASFFNLDKSKDNVCKYVAHRTIQRGDKTFWKAPKVQRLMTEKRIRRKAIRKNATIAKAEKSKTDAAAYEKLISQVVKQRKAARKAADATEEKK
jgi:small subunit ribosomal protein S6e